MGAAAAPALEFEGARIPGVTGAETAGGDSGATAGHSTFHSLKTSSVTAASLPCCTPHSVRTKRSRRCVANVRPPTLRANIAEAGFIDVEPSLLPVSASTCLRVATAASSASASVSQADSITSAGSVFLGDWSPESAGDYASGTNHVLPTDGHARTLSGLSVQSFQKLVTVQEASAVGLTGIGPAAITLAQAEGLSAHALAVQVRLRAIAQRLKKLGISGDMGARIDAEPGGLPPLRIRGGSALQVQSAEAALTTGTAKAQLAPRPSIWIERILWLIIGLAAGIALRSVM